MAPHLPTVIESRVSDGRIYLSICVLSGTIVAATYSVDESSRAVDQRLAAGILPASSGSTPVSA